jgi:two-component system, LytTR family, response regulator
MESKIRVIIVEDEELARLLVKKFIIENQQFELVAECTDGFEGAKAINELKPDLVFLDIQMPRLNGFEVLEIIDSQPKIIFTTAYEEYAIKAFEKNAVDYLLKPFSKERFDQALLKAQDEINRKIDHLNKYQELSASVSEAPLGVNLSRVVVKTGRNIKVIPVNDFKYIEAQDDYVMIYTAEGKYLKQQTMTYYEKVLEAGQFVRIHRSYIVKLDQIKQIEPYDKEGYVVKLKTGETLKMSKSGYKRIRDFM